MSSDLDIVIKLDPAAPVAGAKAVTAEVAKVEAQAEETKGAIARLGASLKTMATAASGELAKAGFSMKEFGQGLKEIGKGQAMGAIREGLAGVTSQVKELTGIPIGGSGTAIGFMLGGPAGAAVGTLVEGMNSGVDSFKRMIEEGARAKGMTESLASAILGFRDKATITWAALTQLNAGFATMAGVVGEVKKKIDDYNLMLDLSGASSAKKYHDQIDTLNQVIKDHPEQADLARRAIDKLNGSHEKAAKSAKAQVDQMQSLRDIMGGYGRVARNAEWAAEDEANRPGFREVDVGGLKPMENKRATASDAVRDLVEMQKQNAEYQKQSAEEAKKQADEAERAKEAIVTMGDVMANELISASKSFSDTLVTAAQGGEVSWAAWGEQVFDSLTRAIAQALILKAITGTFDGSKGVGGYGGIVGALGFASGGTIYPSGPGSTDSMNVAFRKRPDETVHINTPSQEAAYQRGGQGGGSRTQTVNVQADDQRALLQGFDGPEGDRVFLNVVRRNPNAFAALLPRR